MSSLICGIDPGANGAISFIDIYDLSVEIIDMPTYIKEVSGKKRQRYDYHLMADIMGEKADDIIMAYVEEVHSIAGDGHVGSFSFGQGFGMVQATLATYEIPTTLVRPAVWKKNLSVPADKEAARIRASQLMPKLSSVWKLKKHDGRAESALISLYGLSHQGHVITKAITNASTS